MTIQCEITITGTMDICRQVAILSLGHLAIEKPSRDRIPDHVPATLEAYKQALITAATNHPKWAALFVWGDQARINQALEMGRCLFDGITLEALEWFVGYFTDYRRSCGLRPNVATATHLMGHYLNSDPRPLSDDAHASRFKRWGQA